MNKLGLLTLVTAVVISPCVMAHPDSETLTRTQVDSAFRPIGKYYDARKAARNEITDLLVNLTVAEFKALIPQLRTLHDGVRAGLVTFPLLKSTATQTLRNIYDTLSDTEERLESLEQDCSAIVVSEPGSHQYEAPADASDVSGLLGNTPSTEGQTEGSTGTEGPSPAELVVKLEALAKEGDKFTDEQIQEILQQYGENSYLTLRDALEAFRDIASYVGNEHIARSREIAGTVKGVQGSLRLVVQHLSQVRGGLRTLRSDTLALFGDSSRVTLDIQRLANHLQDDASRLECQQDA